MIRGIPTKRRPSLVHEAQRTAPRSPTLMGMQGVGMPPARATSLATPIASAPAAAVPMARALAAVPETAREVAREAGLDPAGPEMAALLALSRDVVERIVWEVVPDLAERIIKENLGRLAQK
jgi:hypothetical protein